MVGGQVGFPPHQLRETQNGVERCTEFVAHAGQEDALGPAGGLGLATSFLQIGDVDVDGDEPDLLPRHDHRQRQQLYVYQRTVPAGSLGGGLDASFDEDLILVSNRLGPNRVVVCHQGVQILADDLFLSVVEQLLGHRIPGDDVSLQVGGHHGDRVVDEERLEVLLLAADLLLISLPLSDLPLGLIEQSGVLDRDGGLLCEQVQQVQIGSVELPGGIGTHGGEDADQLLADQQRHGQRGVQAGVQRHAAFPGAVVLDDQRLTGLGDAAHGPLAQLLPSADGVDAQVVADDDADLLAVFIVEGQFAPGGLQ